MTASDDDKVGYGRPPRNSQWKKGQSGNPHKKPKRTESLVAMIDRLLLSPVKLSLNGETETRPALVAIISQLQLQAMAGSVRASKVLLKYRIFASQHAERQFQVIFKDSETGSAATDPASEADHG